MAAELYGADRAGVQALLTNRRITDSSTPSLTDVDRYLAMVAGWVAGALRIAGVDAPDRDAAAGVILLGAAALTEDAAHPERAGEGDSSYGAVLWDRYQSELERLASGEPEAEASDDDNEGAACSFPEPMFVRDEPF